jgi:phosphatidylglycerol:prolipoprotein diacylglycerol transferase
MDVLAPSIAVGIMFGRLGCFLNGCCYGRPSQLPWAVSFPRSSPPWGHERALGLIPAGAVQSLAIHPTQIYFALDGLVLLLLLSAFYPFRRRDGEVMSLLMVTYPISRFLIEYLRDDEGAFFAGLTISQNISVALLITGLGFWAWLVRQPKVLYRDQHPASRPASILLQAKVSFPPLQERTARR